jgi:hypothetical protein
MNECICTSYQLAYFLKLTCIPTLFTEDLTQNRNQSQPRGVYVRPRQGNSKGQEEVTEEVELVDDGRFASH